MLGMSAPEFVMGVARQVGEFFLAVGRIAVEHWQVSLLVLVTMLIGGPSARRKPSLR